MKTTKRFENAINKLYIAFNENTLGLIHDTVTNKKPPLILLIRANYLIQIQQFL